tara:strand:- start:1223 stop:1615 length:393 start_codon:yes stop_codon:yes gene_type:complete
MLVIKTSEGITNDVMKIIKLLKSAKYVDTATNQIFRGQGGEINIAYDDNIESLVAYNDNMDCVKVNHNKQLELIRNADAYSSLTESELDSESEIESELDFYSPDKEDFEKLKHKNELLEEQIRFLKCILN